MSSGVVFSQTLSADGHAMSVNQAPTRNRSSTISTTPSSSMGSRPDSSYFTNDLLKQTIKVWKPPVRVRSTSNANETGSRYGQPSRLATLSEHIKGRRSSILVTASDVLGLKLGRHKSSRQQPPQSIIFPDIIDISAARADAELEERNRLRDMAAQAIGLQPYTDVQDSCHDCSILDEDEVIPPFDSADLGKTTHAELASPPNPHAQFSKDSSSSVSVAYSQPTRMRSGSTTGHTAATTTSFAPIPPYPSTVSSLSSFRQCEGVYPKYYPHSSLRIFALSKNWKYRYLMMSSPATFVARGQSPAVSYLHVFKSAGSGERELERLEINEDSMVFVSEDQVGGKRSVIKVGGTDVGATKKEYMINEAGYSMWLIYIQDTTDAQRWITNIKNAILGQRTVRAGLIPSYPLGVRDSHGDMDVLLSIRTQGTTTSTSVVTKPVTDVSVTENFSFSSRSVHSLKSTPPPGSPTSLSALKGLFIARSGSASRPASIDADRGQEKESLSTMGNGPLRSRTPDSPPGVTVQGISTHSVPAESINRYLDWKIKAPQSAAWKSSASTNGETTASQTDIILPLQPPPRKRWTASGLSTLNTNLANDALNYSGRPNSLPLAPMFEVSPIATSYLGTRDQRPRASSLQSVSTFASGDHRLSLERRPSSSTKTSSIRRWSKQSLLPSLMSPPSDPLPPVPMHKNNTPSTFSNRTSGESFRSTNTSSMYSRARSSVPPPRPAPTSALPPAPTDLDQVESNRDVSTPLDKMSNAPKSLFRASSVHRSSRLSLIAPKPPPTSSLPPRPGDPDYKPSHRRSSSESRFSNALQSIPDSPIPLVTHHNAHLPPLGSPSPLPPPDLWPLPAPPLDQLPSTNRVSSLKQRLRMLSTGSVNGPSLAVGRSRLSTDRMSIDSSSSPIQTTFLSPPSTPIAEKIIPIQDDGFLQLYTPIMPSLFPGQYPPRDQQDLQPIAVTSLSPPPRRGPKQSLESDYICPQSPIFFSPEEQLNTIHEKQNLLASPTLSPDAQNSGTSTDDWILAEDSSGTETKLTSFLDSEHDICSSRPSSIISLGLRGI